MSMTSPPKLLLRHPVGDQVRWTEVPPTGLRIGRREGCGIVIPHDEVSREHAELCFEQGRWILRDLHSANGTWIAGARIAEHALQDGDRIQIDDCELLCWIDAPSAARALSDSMVCAGPGLDVASFEKLVAQVLPERERTPLGEARTLLRLFHRATETLLGHDELDAALQSLLALVFEHLPAERATVLLVDPSSGRLVPRWEHVLPGVAASGQAVSRHIAEEALRSKQAVLVGDAAADERFSLAESIRAQHIASAMCAPLCHGGRVGGLLYVDRSTSGAAFGATELGVLSILSTIGAAALERAQIRASLEHERRVRERLGRYHAPSVVARIASAAERAGGVMQSEERELTVLFADLAGFTRFAEQLPAREVTQVLNRILEQLTQAVFAAGGTLDKFLGDAVMAFFGAPLAQPDHASRAVRAALDMQERLRVLNETEPPERRLSLHVGINTGTAIVGDIGAEQRLDYTVIGDTVNIASRLQSTVAHADEIAIGAATWALVRDEFEATALPPVVLRGRSGTLEPYLVRGRRHA
ncbi:MAG: FHA domain-containing protein [Planctomycetes bacterium]|nr:FHA domain-containing protein [Planctomycetota bacterium]